MKLTRKEKLEYAGIYAGIFFLVFLWVRLEKTGGTMFHVLNGAKNVLLNIWIAGILAFHLLAFGIIIIYALKPLLKTIKR